MAAVDSAEPRTPRGKISEILMADELSNGEFSVEEWWEWMNSRYLSIYIFVYIYIYKYHALYGDGDDDDDDDDGDDGDDDDDDGNDDDDEQFLGWV